MYMMETIKYWFNALRTRLCTFLIITVTLLVAIGLIVMSVGLIIKAGNDHSQLMQCKYEIWTSCEKALYTDSYEEIENGIKVKKDDGKYITIHGSYIIIEK